MSNDITDAGYARLSERIDALRVTVEAGFTHVRADLRDHRLETRAELDKHEAEDKAERAKLEERIRKLEAARDTTDGRNYEARITALVARIRDLERWRWWIAGAIAAAGGVGGIVGSAVGG